MGRMGGAGIGLFVSALAPEPSAAAVSGREEQWRRFDNPVDAVSFGFVATAILISMFLVMAIFERFLRGRETAEASVAGGRSSGEVELGKNNFPSPKMAVYPNGVSVLMPGEKIPTFIAHHAPAPCPSERAT